MYHVLFEIMVLVILTIHIYKLYDVVGVYSTFNLVT